MMGKRADEMLLSPDPNSELKISGRRVGWRGDVSMKQSDTHIHFSQMHLYTPTDVLKE